MSRFTTLLWLRLRSDGIHLLIWVAAAALLTYASSTALSATFAEEAERRSLLAVALANPVILLFRGLPSGPSEGAFLVFTVLPFLVLLTALMAGFLAVRHVRADEETGRAELVAATPAARTLPLTATVVLGIAACFALGAATAVALMLSGLDALGSAMTGASLAAAGTVFFAFALVCAQIFRSARAANTLSVTAIVTTYLVAGIGNALGTPSDDLTRMTSSALAWFSPFAWAENTRPFADDDLGPLLLSLAVAAALGAIAIALQRARDIGSGLLPERHGRTDASPLLSSQIGLVWRLSAGSLAALAVGAAVIGALATSLGTVVGEVATGNPAVEAILQQIAAQGSMDEGLLVTFFLMVGVLAACFGVQTVLRARQEETHGTAEATLATVVHRSAWLGAFLAVALIGIIVIVGVAVSAAGVALLASSADSGLFAVAAVSGAGQVAAASVFTVLAAVVFALAPRAAVFAGWTLVIAAGCLALFGTLFGLDEAIVAISPFAATPVPSGDGFDLNGIGWLVPAAVAGAAAALVAMRRRELSPGG